MCTGRGSTQRAAPHDTWLMASPVVNHDQSGFFIVCGCLAACVYGCVCMWLCVCMAVCVCGCVWVCGWVCVWVLGGGGVN